MFFSPFEKMKKLQEEEQKKLQEQKKQEDYIQDFSKRLGIEVPASNIDFKNIEMDNELKKILNPNLKNQTFDYDPNNKFSISENSPTPIDDLYDITPEINSDLREFFDVSDDLLEDTYLNPSSKSKRVFKFYKFKNSKQQFISLLGTDQQLNLEKERIISECEDYKIIDINVQRMYSYTSPYLFVIKKIINQFNEVHENDREFMWKRIELLLSATQFGMKSDQFNHLVEDTLQLDDPIELISKEFKTVIKAYDVKQKFAIFLTDFRGIEFSEMIKIISFINIVFTGIMNIKFLILLNLEEFGKVKYNLDSYVNESFILKNSQIDK